MSARIFGTVTSLNAQRGFGFVQDEDGTYHFFHMSECRSAFKSLWIDARVSFRSQSTERGPRANDVCIAS